MSDQMDPKKDAQANPPSRQEPPKYTGLLPSIDGDKDVSSSRKLDFSIAVERMTDRYRDADHLLMIYFPQRAEPFLFADVDAVLIGRSTDQPVDLDTTSFHGRELGVSRHHAEITYENGAYYVRDLKSTNGTWLNGERLDPMKKYRVTADDQLRLGHCLMILYVRE
ncbi:MAG: FHA domain-containing protein [Anaerolineae bacterium]